MMSLLVNLILTLLVVLLCIAVPWGMRSVKTWQIGLVFGVSFVLWILGAAFSLGWYPWVSLLDLIVALSAGILLGRAIPAKFWPYFIFLAAFSIFDVVQILLTTHFATTSTLSSSITLTPGEYYSNVFLILPWITYHFGPGDLLILVIIGTYWSKQQGEFWLAFAGLAIGVFVIYPVRFVYPQMILPLIPCLFLGWLLGGVFMRSRKQTTIQKLPG